MFLICGEALYDVFLSEETATGFSLDARIGGSPFNVAIGLSRLGRAAALFGGISSDPLGRRLEGVLREEGVDTRFVVSKVNPTTLALVGLDESGVPQYSFYGHEAADRALGPADLPSLSEDITGLHFGSYSLVVEPTGSTLLALARQQTGQSLISLDPNVRLNVEPDTLRWRERIEAFARAADLIKVSDEDLETLFPATGPCEVATAWHRQGVQLVVITRGAEGALVSLRGEVFETPGRQVDTVDTVGAGDTFQAALLCGLQELGRATREGLVNLPLDDCRRIVAFAVEAAGVTCGRRGADLPRREELPTL
ncbi:carbohydrate kinase [Pelagibius litoralis]|uniref:Carbohydrate kinase n=1 Tax=Pelagibius litoralis TaxID=374515 RepID=A0A967EYV0_9PROT|nr:carbohydrate kinase [Pelagibius litoralis]NIA69952.1 carbohydrate kinase [Pelagibius litoralis]